LMILIRFKPITSYPKYSHILRIWRFKPWVRIILKISLLICSTLQFLVTVSKIEFHFHSFNTICNGFVDGYRIFFSWLFLARNILLTMSPSLVMNINPSLALSIVQLGKYVSGN
jgi:hypothetical protein